MGAKSRDNIGEAHVTDGPSGASRGRRKAAYGQAGVCHATFAPHARRESGMRQVLVLSSDRKPLDPCHPARARKLLASGKAAVFRRYPFAIILNRPAGDCVTQSYRLKVDPGSRTTGIALVRSADNVVMWAMTLEHRGQRIKKLLDTRRQLRRRRRTANLRYRPPRFLNRAASRRKGRLPPSLWSRVANVTTWVWRLCRWAPVDAISLELAKFDTQKMENPEISEVEYQQGTLTGYDVREYLLEKWGRRCAYCGGIDRPLEVEHIRPKSQGGSDRVSNLTLSCGPCNAAKGARTAAEYGHPKVEIDARRPLKDAAVMNATRWALYWELQRLGLPLECGTGARTKYNRTRAGMAKSHWADAACVGESGEGARLPQNFSPLRVRAMGHGRRQKVITDKYGFPRTHKARAKHFGGWQTGDVARVVLGKHTGVVGRVVIRHSGSFTVGAGLGVNYKKLERIHRADGYYAREGSL